MSDHVTFSEKISFYPHFRVSGIAENRAKKLIESWEEKFHVSTRKKVHIYNVKKLGGF